MANAKSLHFAPVVLGLIAVSTSSAVWAFAPVFPTVDSSVLDSRFSLRGAVADWSEETHAGRSTVDKVSFASGVSALAALSFGLGAIATTKTKTLSRIQRNSISPLHGAAEGTAPHPRMWNSAEPNPAIDKFKRDLGFAAGLVGNKHAFGDYNFDPCDFAEKLPHYLPWFREAELKHGRVCMLAFVGLVAPEIVRIPGPDPCYSANIVDAHNACVGDSLWAQTGPMMQIAGWIFIVEFCTAMPKYHQGLTLENAGDYRLGLQFLPAERDAADKKRMAELKNGRLAMIAFGGAITQAVVSGNGFPWLFAEGRKRPAPGFGASVPSKSGLSGFSGKQSKLVRYSEGYKMSKSVPFLPVSPALEGFPGEEDGFDPMGFSLAIDVRWLREAELKHARVAMLATVGWIATDLGMRVEGEPFQVSTMEAHDAMVKFGSMPQMLVWLGYAEAFGFLAIVNMMEGKTERKPGDFGIRTLYPKDEPMQYDMQLRELRNGRLAMLAFGGIVTVATLTGKVWPFLDATGENKRNLRSGNDSTLCGKRKIMDKNGIACRKSGVARACSANSRSLPFLPKPEFLRGWVGEEAEFDPIGFSDTFDMKWLREAELKHGRVCMVATVGYVSQQYIAFPGVEVTPNANDAIYTGPVAGIAALVLACGWIESTSYNGKMTMLDMFDDKSRVPGDLNFGTGMLNNVSEARAYDLKLKELNNGRLAMLAFGGMVHHNLVVNEPLFPIFPEDWKGPQGSWQLNSVMGAIVEGRIGNELIPPGMFA